MNITWESWVNSIGLELGAWGLEQKADRDPDKVRVSGRVAKVAAAEQKCIVVPKPGPFINQLESFN